MDEEKLCEVLEQVGLDIKSGLLSLGNADASPPMGGLEVLGVVLKEGMMAIAQSLSNIAAAIEEK